MATSELKSSTAIARIAVVFVMRSPADLSAPTEMTRRSLSPISTLKLLPLVDNVFRFISILWTDTLHHLFHCERT
jgi:hypothetical protein